MDFISFLHQSRTPQFWQQTTLVALTSSEYPALFVSDFLTHTSRILPDTYMGITTLDLHARPVGECMAALHTSFLGMHSMYWLHNISELSGAAKQQWMSYLASYQGPHCIIVYVAPADADAFPCIELPSTIDKQLFTQLLSFFAGQQTAQRAQAAVTTLYTRHNTLPLDTACSILRYIQLMGNQYQPFFDSWLDTFIVPETSLFTLSQHFFARAPQKFFAAWSAISPQYGQQFWIAFWSEQLWRAYHVVDCLQQSRFVEAKSLSYRLPFSLMQQDWKKLSLAELQQAHAFLYGIDGALKNGGNGVFLDLFYSKFFLQQF